MDLTYIFIIMAIIILLFDLVIIIAMCRISSKASRLEEKRLKEIEKLEETLRYENKKD